MFDNFKPVKKIVTSYISPKEKKYKEYDITKKDLFLGYDKGHKPVILDEDIVRQHFFIIGDEPTHTFYSFVKHNLSNYASGLILKSMSQIEMNYINFLACAFDKMDSIKFISFKRQPLFNHILPISLNMIADIYPEIQLALQIGILSPHINDEKTLSYGNLFSYLKDRIESLQITRTFEIESGEDWTHLSKYNPENQIYQDAIVIDSVIKFLTKVNNILKELQELDIILVPHSEVVALNWIVFLKTNLIICPNLTTEENKIMISIYKYLISFFMSSAMQNIKDPESNISELSTLLEVNHISENKIMIYLELNGELIDFLNNNIQGFAVLCAQSRGVGIYNIFYLKSLPSEGHRFVSNIIANTNTKIITKSADSLRSLYNGHYSDTQLNLPEVYKVIILDQQIDLIPESSHIGFKPVNRFVNI